MRTWMQSVATVATPTRPLTERVPHRNRPTVNVHLGLIEAKQLAICDGHDGKCLVDLIKIHLFGGPQQAQQSRRHDASEQCIESDRIHRIDGGRTCEAS